MAAEAPLLFELGVGADPLTRLEQEASELVDVQTYADGADHLAIGGSLTDTDLLDLLLLLATFLGALATARFGSLHLGGVV